MNKNKIWLLLAMIAIVGVAVISCPPPEEEEVVKVLGSISISPSGESKIGTLLTANYEGTETVAYQWKKDGSTNVGTNAKTFKADEEGSYTVTISLEGYPSKTSSPVSITDRVLFVGTWRATTDDIVVITNNKLSYYFDEVANFDEDTELGLQYAVTITEWKAVTSDSQSYPKGFKLSGTLSNKDGGWGPTDSTGTEYGVNKSCDDYWYISSDGESIVYGLWDGNPPKNSPHVLDDTQIFYKETTK